MSERFAILKGYALHIVFHDGSDTTLHYRMNELANIETELAARFKEDLDSIQSFTVTKIWSQPGETVSIPMTYQS